MDKIDIWTHGGGCRCPHCYDESLLTRAHLVYDNGADDFCHFDMPDYGDTITLKDQYGNIYSVMNITKEV